MTQHQISLSLQTQSDRDWATAYSLLSTVAMDAGPRFNNINLHSMDLDDVEPTEDGIEEFHDENTMTKVYDALRSVVIMERDGMNYKLDDDQATSIITAMQNAGIKFREIKQS